MIVLDRNLFDIEPTDIGDTRVLRTIVGGDIVYSRLVHGD
jgi:predicted amidohydrolase YtcJ